MGSKCPALKPSRGLSLRSSSEWHGEVGSKGGKRGTRCSPPRNTQQSMSCRGLEGRGVLAQPLNLVESFLPKVDRNQVCPLKVPFTGTWVFFPPTILGWQEVTLWLKSGRWVAEDQLVGQLCLSAGSFPTSMRRLFGYLGQATETHEGKRRRDRTQPRCPGPQAVVLWSPLPAASNCERRKEAQPPAQRGLD